MWSVLDIARKAAPRSLRCSFCGRSEKQVNRLVAGARAYCDDCVAKCASVLHDTALTPDRHPPQHDSR